MRQNRFLRVLKIAAIACIGIAVGGEAVVQLWNWLMPAVFGWRSINFLQALGLVVLSRIFFGGFRGRPGFGGSRRMMARWQQLTPEQREQFKKGMRGRCGRFEEPAPEATA